MFTQTYKLTQKYKISTSKALSVFIAFALLSQNAFANFYAMNDKWEQSHSSGAVPKATAIENGFSDAIAANRSSNASISLVPVTIRKTLSAAVTETTIEIEHSQTLLLENCQGIEKFIATDDGIVELSSEGSENFIIKGVGIGRTFIHIWNTSGRNTFEVRVIPQKIANTIYQQKYEEKFDKNRSFKIDYDLNRSAYYTGGQVSSLRRNSLDMNQGLAVNGDSPYGAMHAHALTQRAEAKTLLTDIQMKLSDGKIGDYRNFDVALGDSSVSPAFMVFPSTRIRGVDLSHWDDNKRLSWDTFYGREQSSIIGTLTPGIVGKRTKDSKLGGAYADFKLNDSAGIRGGYFRGNGRARTDELNRNGAALAGKVKLGPYVTLSPESDFDNENFAHKHAMLVQFEKLTMRGEYRDINERFQTLLGTSSRQGEKGYLFEFSADPFTRFGVRGSIDIFRDRLVPNPEDLYGRNIHTDLGASWAPTDSSSFSFNFQDLDDTARIGPTRQRSFGVQYNQQIVDAFKHKYSLFTRYQNRGNRVLTNSLSDYVQNQLVLGVQTKVFWDLDFSVQKEWSHLEEPNIRRITHPSAIVYNLGLPSRQISDTPFYVDANLRVRDEEETESVNSFMSGNDSAEISGNIFYRPDGDFEFYLNGSLTNYSVESQLLTAPRAEAQFLFGMHYTYDTKVRWTSASTFDGFVYKDTNADGVKQVGEVGLEGIKVYSADGKEVVTDKQGYYKLPFVSGQYNSLTMDIAKVPYGYAPTTPTTQDVEIKHGATQRLSFGVTPRSELSGIVFNDINGDGKYDVGEKGVRKVKIVLENGKVARSNEIGVYTISDVLAGPHVASIDLISLPEGYLPQDIPKKNIDISEGMRYELHFPMKAIRNVTGRVYADLNKNGSFDPEEKIVPNVKVGLGNKTVTSDADGWYLFDDMSAGVFKLQADGSSVSEVKITNEPTSITLDIPLQSK